MSAVETWRISRGKAACCACGKEFQPNQGLFSALREEGEEFLRHDFCPSCWPAQQEASFFCHCRAILRASLKPIPAARVRISRASPSKLRPCRRARSFNRLTVSSSISRINT